ncbi:uncharacterized protein F5891DRAFT_1199621 [Suillus fuscotomentosus]|uniref:Uncharacterized protein n=1 Tax=Suillus fuscotomentosus TaxID=1912939 RepID=A0AAD4DP74_9AGAM|nr:uncharacterized protein F5891DRAFT_1199621 [Suillus fuscotomentosus]KAG1887540.1 hypothetical protein F5891DRAFT_1199621 [Suillus fuscotomentosus]
MVLNAAEGLWVPFSKLQRYSRLKLTSPSSPSRPPPLLSFWRLPVWFAYVRATSAFADMRWACALSTGGCWDRAVVNGGLDDPSIPLETYSAFWPFFKVNIGHVSSTNARNCRYLCWF